MPHPAGMFVDTGRNESDPGNWIISSLSRIQEDVVKFWTYLSFAHLSAFIFRNLHLSGSVSLCLVLSPFAVHLVPFGIISACLDEMGLFYCNLRVVSKLFQSSPRSPPDRRRDGWHEGEGEGKRTSVVRWEQIWGHNWFESRSSGLLYPNLVIILSSSLISFILVGLYSLSSECGSSTAVLSSVGFTSDSSWGCGPTS